MIDETEELGPLEAPELPIDSPVCVRAEEKPIDPNRQVITEEMGVHKEWFVQADEITPETLDAFIKHLINDYDHDYGTICHAIVAGAVATAKAIDRSPQGGITGFQAGCIMWGFIEHYNHIKGPARLVEFEDMLYPQYENRFAKTITKETWEHLQQKAKELLSDNTEDNVSPRVWNHWELVRDGMIPFGYEVAADKD